MKKRNDFPDREYLKGMQCPRCGNKKSFFVEVTVTGTLTEDAFEICEGGGGLNFTELSRCSCNDCTLGDLEGHVALFTKAHPAYKRYKKDEVQLLPFIFTGTYDAGFNETAEQYEGGVVWAERAEDVPALEKTKQGWDFALADDPFSYWEVLRADTRLPVYNIYDAEDAENGK